MRTRLPPLETRVPRAMESGWRREAGGSRAMRPPRATHRSARASLPRVEGLRPAVGHGAGGPAATPPFPG